MVAGPIDSRPLGHLRPPAGRTPSAIALTGLRQLREAVERDATPTAVMPRFERPAGTGHNWDGRFAARILLIDDCTLQRENLAAILANDSGSAPAVAWDLPSVCAAVTESTPDIVLLSMATRDSITLLRAVREACPQARPIVVGISESNEADIIACAEAGVAGYHLRTQSLDELLRLISKVFDGESVCSPKVSAILLRRLSALATQRPACSREPVLTTREVQILRMLEMGLSNRDIAARLCITLHTVKNHVHSVLNKLGVSTRAEAAALSRSFR